MNNNIVSKEREIESDDFIKGMIENIDAYRKPDRSLAEHLLIMDLQSLREIIRKEKQGLKECVRPMTGEEVKQMINRLRSDAEQYRGA